MVDEYQRQREILGKYKNNLFTIIALYAVYSEAKNPDFCYDTILLKKVKDVNQFPLCDHLWVKAPKFVPYGIKPGHWIKVHGRVQEYRRLDGTTDFTIFVFNIKRAVVD